MPRHTRRHHPAFHQNAAGRTRGSDFPALKRERNFLSLLTEEDRLKWGKGSFEVWRKWECDPWSPWGARIARWRGSSGREGEPVRLMRRSPRRGRAAPRGCSHACAEFLAWQRFFVPFQAYLGHGTPTADHFPNFGHFRAAGRAGGLSGSEVRFLGK